MAFIHLTLDVILQQNITFYEKTVIKLNLQFKWCIVEVGVSCGDCRGEGEGGMVSSMYFICSCV